jgi:monothiol glutaredoxin
MNPFQVVSNEITSYDKSLPLNEQIKKLLTSDKVVLFMKGNSDFPQCGFSANTVQILKQVGTTYKTFNILNDPDIRQGLKEYSQWPTYPQLYINGQLVGGNDIVTQLYQNGELQAMLKN